MSFSWKLMTFTGHDLLRSSFQLAVLHGVSAEDKALHQMIIWMEGSMDFCESYRKSLIRC